MSQRKNISVRADLYEQLEAWKPANQSFDTAIRKLLESVETEQATFGATSVESLHTDKKTFEATEQGTLEFEIKDDENRPIGVVTLSELGANQTVFAEVQSND